MDDILSGDIFPTIGHSALVGTDKNRENGRENVRHSDEVAEHGNSADLIR